MVGRIEELINVVKAKKKLQRLKYTKYALDKFYLMRQRTHIARNYKPEYFDMDNYGGQEDGN